MEMWGIGAKIQLFSPTYVPSSLAEGERELSSSFAVFTSLARWFDYRFLSGGQTDWGLPDF